jgi:predicted RNA-binding protein associated with RNAse of E/G family
MTTGDVQELIAALRSGALTLEEVATRFRDRSWPEQAAPDPQTYLELAAETLRDPEPDVPGSFDEVTAAYDRGELTRDQYRTLAHAVAEAINAEVRREAE